MVIIQVEGEDWRFLLQPFEQALTFCWCLSVLASFVGSKSGTASMGHYQQFVFDFHTAGFFGTFRYSGGSKLEDTVARMLSFRGNGLQLAVPLSHFTQRTSSVGGLDQAHTTSLSNDM